MCRYQLDFPVQLLSHSVAEWICYCFNATEPVFNPSLMQQDSCGQSMGSKAGTCVFLIEVISNVWNYQGIDILTMDRVYSDKMDTLYTGHTGIQFHWSYLRLNSQ